ncbi:Tumor susceptibility gene 101 protein [Termitomyces sp. J132]|nr:Tumor susceptibility gene 101 protein [Termitomyces sp. J132]
MSSAQSLTQKWLRHNAQPYPNPDRVYADIDLLLQRYSTLRPKSDVYTFDDGRTQLLLCVHGLLPISFRGASYNIPVAIWLAREYPKQPPIAYVVPTNDMLVKPGKHLDVSGRCNIEYIQHWERKSEGCNLSALVEAMQVQFSEEPPVYAKPPQTVGPTTPPRYARPIGLNAPVPYVPYHDTQSNGITSLATGPSPTLPLPPSSAASAPSNHVVAPQPPSPEYSIVQPVRAPTVNLLDEDSPDAILNAPSAFAPPPPRPPNPELLRLHDQVHQKLTSELSSLSQALALDAERLRAHQTDLLAGEPAIHDEMARLEAVRDVCRNVALRLKSSVQQAEANITELRRKGDPEVDELICSTTIVHNQLITLIAEDNAIEDTIYHLHRALNSGRIDLERFLRSTRLLAEEQFMKRALIERIQEGIPMGMSMSSDWS